MNRLWYRVDGGAARAAAAEREGTPIMAFVGANGGGKTWAAIYTLLPVLLDGQRWECAEPSHQHTHTSECAYRRRRECDCNLAGQTHGERFILSTVPLFRPGTRELHPRCTLLHSYQQLVQLEHADVLLDEATAVADAQDHQSLPAPVRNILAQQRKRDVRILWTTPDYSNANKRIRQVTQGVVYCSGGSRVKAQREGQVWRESRRLRWTLYATADFEVFTATQRLNGKPLSTQVVWRPDHPVDGVYDTQALSITLGVASDGGACLGCGGRRSAPRCECPPDPSAVPDGVVETVDPRGTRRRRVALLEHEARPGLEPDLADVTTG